MKTEKLAKARANRNSYNFSAMIRDEANVDIDAESAENRAKRLFSIVSEMKIDGNSVEEGEELDGANRGQVKSESSFVDKIKKAGKKLSGQEKRSSIHEIVVKERVQRSQSEPLVEDVLLWRKGHPLFVDAESKLIREQKLLDQFTREGTCIDEQDGDSSESLISFELISANFNISPRGSQSQSEFPIPTSPSRFKALRRLSLVHPIIKSRRNTKDTTEENGENPEGGMRRVPICGSLELIVQWLVSENIESKLMHCFFSTYEGIGITSEQVLHSIQSVYQSYSELVESSTINKMNEWQRKRTLRFMGIWLETCYEDEEPSERKKLKEAIKSFVNTYMPKDKEFEWEYLEELIKRPVDIDEHITETEGDGSSQEKPSSRVVINTDSKDKLKARSHEILRRKSSRLSQVFTGFSHGSSSSSSTSSSLLHRFTSAQLATQLHIAELKVFRSINVRKEIGNKRWAKPDAKECCPNVVAMIDGFNKISNWVVSEVITSDSDKTKADAIQKFIMIAHECRLRNNFNSLMEILAGLGQHIVCSLRSAWDLVPVKYVSQLRELEEFMSVSGNFKTYRETLKASKETATALHPSLPYMGLYLRDISVANEINPDFIPLEDKQTINFVKMRMIGSMLYEIQSFQYSSYLFKLDTEEDPTIQNYLFNITNLNEETISQIQTKNKLAVSK